MAVYEIQDKDGTTFEIDSPTEPTVGQIKKAVAIYKRQNITAPKTAEQIQGEMNASGDTNIMQDIGRALAPRSMEQSLNQLPEKQFDPNEPEFIDTPGGKMFNSKKYELNPNVGKNLATAGADALSLAGRTVASAPEILNVKKALTEPREYARDIGNSMSQTESQKSGVAGFGADVLRSPATGAAALTGGLGAGYLPASAAGAAGTQMENISKGQEVNPVEAGVETAAGVVGGKLAKSGGEILLNKSKKLIGNQAEKITNAGKKFLEAEDFESLRAGLNDFQDALKNAADHNEVEDIVAKKLSFLNDLGKIPGITGQMAKVIDLSKNKIMHLVGKLGKRIGDRISKNPEDGIAAAQESARRAE